MTPLRQRMQDAMLQRGFAERTQGSYVEAISRMARYYRRDPSLLSPEEVAAYLLHLVKDRKLAFSTVNQAASACRFLFEKSVGSQGRRIAPAHGARAAQATALARARGDRSHLCLLCSSGASPRAANHVRQRLAHLRGLRPDRARHRQRRRPHVRARQRGQGRCRPLQHLEPDPARTAAPLLPHLRPAKAPRRVLFPNAQATGCTNIENVQRAYQAARQCAGITKHGGTHTLRHCFGHPRALTRWTC